jgi:hypothetical protein
MVTAALGLLLMQAPKFTVRVLADDSDGLRADITSYGEIGVGAVEKFFGARFAKPFDIDVFGDRKDLDAAVRRRWNMPRTEKWMVAMGVADKLFLLSPRSWRSQATEHDGGDPVHVQQIVTHELTHVFHGQQCPKHEFDGMDSMAWFIEGLATYVAGQLDGKMAAARQAIEAGKGPKNLDEVWTGQTRYAMAGSIVQYVDHKFGRPKLVELLKMTDNPSALKALGVDEKQLLDGWRTSVSAK